MCCHESGVSEVFPERCSLKARTEGGRVIQAGTACAGDWRPEGVGPEMTSLGHRVIWKATGDGKDGS